MVTISGCQQMLMRGTSNYKMNRHPFTLLQITVSDGSGNTTSETYVAYSIQRQFGASCSPLGVPSQMGMASGRAGNGAGESATGQAL